MKLEKFEAFFFDIGNVLLCFDRDVQLKQVSRATGIKVGTLQREFLDSGLMNDFEKGLLTDEELYDRLAKLSGTSWNQEVFLQAFTAIFEENLPMTSLLKTLKKRGKRILLLSNTNGLHFDYIRRHYDFVQYVDHAILSHEVKSLKPEPMIFQEALRAADTRPGSCFYFDDIPEYTRAAQELGIQAATYNQQAHEDFAQRYLVAGV